MIYYEGVECMAKKDLEFFTKALMNFCLKKRREKDFPIPLININVLDSFWEKLYQDDRFKGIFSYEIAEAFILEYMGNYTGNTVGDNDIHNFITALQQILKANVTDFWFFSPLKGALLNQSVIRGQSMVILNGNNSNGQLELKRIIGDDFYEEVMQKHYLNTDYKDILIGYRIVSQTEAMMYNANAMSFFVNAALHLYYYAYIYPDFNYGNQKIKYQLRKKFTLPMRDTEDIKRIILSSTLNSDLRVARYDTSCELDLTFLAEASHMAKFNKLLDTLIKTYPVNKKMVQDVLGVLKFFKGAIEQKRNLFLGSSMSIVLLTTASESLFPKTEGTIRDNLKNRMSTTYNGSAFNQQEIFDLVDIMYTARSEFVHSGSMFYNQSDQLFDFMHLLANCTLGNLEMNS